jgi:subtilisin family serine protease
LGDPFTYRDGRTEVDDTFAEFSNFGEDIDLAAPGARILSTVPSGDRLNGTSMATPHVTGTAALHLAAHPGASPDQVREVLIERRREPALLPDDPDEIAEGLVDASRF